MARVLVIDDDAAITGLLVDLLTDEGHQARAAVDSAALALAAEWQPQVILLDLMMPGLDGFTIHRRLQADLTTRAIPVVVMSAGRNLRQHSNQLAVQGFLPKPFDIIDVLNWVDRLAEPPATLPPTPTEPAPEPKAGEATGAL